MKKEVRLGGLGPDMESEDVREKVKKVSVFFYFLILKSAFENAHGHTILAFVACSFFIAERKN